MASLAAETRFHLIAAFEWSKPGPPFHGPAQTHHPSLMTQTFTAIDFETANHARTSICQVGLVRVEAGVIIRELSLLVQPPQNYYLPKFTEIHGIKPADTFHAPTFEEVWPQLEPYIMGQRVVAHNGPSFDFNVLRQTLAHYSLRVPAFEGICTFAIYRKNLAALCTEHSIELNHHDALSDARACAALYLRHLGVTSLKITVDGSATGASCDN